MKEQSRAIHRFWDGRDLPEDYARFGEDWQRLNPDWDIVLWSEESIISIIKDSYPYLLDIIEDLKRRDAGRHGIEYYVQLADIAGYVLVHMYGGVYANCDMQPVRPLPELPNLAWASLENNEDGRIVNAIIGAPTPQNEFWGIVLAGLSNSYFSKPGAEMVETTGPAYLTLVAELIRDLIYVYPTHIFNPVHWKQIEPGGDASGWLDSLHPETVAVHHWGHKKDLRSNLIETATQ